MTARTLALLAVSAVLGVLPLATPSALADDPLGPIRAAVNGERAKSRCAPFAYNTDMERGAQAAVHGGDPTGGQVYNYTGLTTLIKGNGDPEAEAIRDAIKRGRDLINDCRQTEFGVGFYRDGSLEWDSVAIIFGRPKPAPSAPPPTSQTTLVPIPAVTPPPKVAPKDAVRVSFDKGFQWTVNVTSTADIAGKCTYSATNPVLPGSNKTFDIAPKGTANFTVLAPPPFSTYHVVVSCRGTFDGKDVEFGHVEQDVSA